MSAIPDLDVIQRGFFASREGVPASGIRELRCITIKLPWADAIRDGIKLVENRTRPTSYRGPVGIHAGAAWSTEGASDPRIVGWAQRRWAVHPNELGVIDATAFSAMFRNVIAVADLVDCHPADGCCWLWGDAGPDVHHLVLADVRPLAMPVPARGSLGLPWVAPAEVAAAVWAQLPAEAAQ